MNDDYEDIMRSAQQTLQAGRRIGEDRAREKRESELASLKTAEFAAKQTALLNEANRIAREARSDAAHAKKETAKATRRSFWSNIIAILSFIVASASFALAVFQYYVSGT